MPTKPEIINLARATRQADYDGTEARRGGVRAYKPKRSTRVCVQCGRQFEKVGAKSSHKFCGDLCRHAYRKQQERARDYSTRLKCAVCESEFLSKFGNTKYCSEECRAQKRSKIVKYCVNCGKEFKSFKNRFKYCSHRCADEKQVRVGLEIKALRRIKAKNAQPKPALQRQPKPRKPRDPNKPIAYVLTEKECAHCGGVFTGKKSARYCGKHCMWRANTKIKKYRKRQTSNAYESVHMHYIAKRDGYKCHICNKKVLMKEACPHPLSPSIDHLIPLSLGGTHTRDNVKLAHFVCNSRKHTKAIGEQLLLIG